VNEQSTNLNGETNHQSTTAHPLPRPQRRIRRARIDRGLPPDQELIRLAQAYLQYQQKAWPELLKDGLISDASEGEILRMVEDFKQRHRTGQVETERLQSLVRRGLKLAGNYDRYSCENSNPTSILDQMINALRKARDENQLIPWEYVFADYSQSGLSSARQGYSSYKQVLSNDGQFITTTYVDDFTRASRDELEWWRLASLSKRLGKRMIGASDGFDLHAVDWDVKISIYGLLSRLFVKGLREKVKRGMRGAARRGTCVGLLSLGFTRCVALDEQGNPRMGADDKPLYRPCIDPVSVEYRRLIHELFTQKLWSAHRIAKHFNCLKVEGWDGWTAAGIRNLLWNPSAIGVFNWNRTRNEYDPEKEKKVKLPNPRSEWEVYYDPKLAIIPMEWWRVGRRRLSAIRSKTPTGPKLSRNQRSASTLFSGTLECEYCKRELTLYRSCKDKYKVMGCGNGPTGVRGCLLSSTKSVRIIEKCLLDFIFKQLFGKNSVRRLVEKANHFLHEEAKKKPIETKPLKKKIAESESVIKQLFKRIEGQSDAGLCQAYDKRIAEHQKEVNKLKQELRKAESHNVKPPPPLSLETVNALVADLRQVLNQEVPVAAEALRALTGPIKIKQEKTPGKRGAKWIATFSPNFLGILSKVAKSKNYPDSVTLEYLCARKWITSNAANVVIEGIPIYEQIAPKVLELRERGLSMEVIAGHLKTNTANVLYANQYGLHGIRPKSEVRKRTGTGVITKYTEIADEVVRLREEEKLLFSEIARRLGCYASTVRRAYDSKRPLAITLAVEHGKRPQRGRTHRLAPALFERMRELISEGKSAREIATCLNCGRNTVLREKKKMSAADHPPAQPQHPARRRKRAG
jgi:DNA invertase Pin-like site-specific DNA recombinase